MDHDAVLEEIGGFGKYQIKILLFLLLPVIFSSANTVAYIFIARAPPYRCYIDQCEQFESATYDQDWLQYAVPGSISSGKFVPEGCFKYSYNDIAITGNNTCQANLFSQQIIKCDSWIFDENEVTMINDWPSEMTCTENEWKLALIGTSNFAGVMMGSAVFGLIADLYGRQPTFIFANIFMVFTGIGQALSISYTMLFIFTLLNSAGTTGVYFSVFVLIIEMLDKKKRELSSVLLNYMFAIGGVMAGVIVYFERNWRHLTLWIAAPPIIFIFEYWFVPESLCWLLSNKLYSRAYKIVQKAAKDNKKELSANIINQFETQNGFKASELQESQALKKRSKTNYIELLKSKILLIRILVLCFIWSTNTLVFYGLSLYSVSLSGNIYFNFIFGSLIEIPGTTIAWIVMNKIGRRYSLVISFLICGIGSVVGAFVDAEIVWLQVCSFLISKMAISTAFTITCVYTAEMMPTNTRSGCVGAFSTISRLSSLLAPFVPLLKNYYSFLPLLVFGSFPLAAGCLSLLLPETLGSSLPDTIIEAENIGI
ncbi:unnamed protein product [Chironomus riparius]|uniref:Major facilitator superfamily (MFS) profile domain-containing protein n=1 Tax=Chironomus riparius TaxID=315576 RepID=A0A9N9RY11_9DIPT|nr:unnamed protein product [Chironomus riparius]